MPSVTARIVFAGAFGLLLLVLWFAHRSATELHRFRSDDPTVWERDIEAFEREARAAPPPPGAVVFLGASTVRFWDSIAEDMAPLPAVARGFGGAKLGDLVHYADRLVTLPAPVGAVVVVTSANDFFDTGGNQPRDPGEAVALARALIERLETRLPAGPDGSGVPIVLVAMRAPVRDPAGTDPASRANAALRELAASDPRVAFIDPNDALYTREGRIDPRMLSWGGGRLSRQGYRVWSKPIREQLLRTLGAPDAR